MIEKKFKVIVATGILGHFLIVPPGFLFNQKNHLG